jgi:hypothetical protein
MVEKLKKKCIDFNRSAEGCGLEDRNITDRYEAMGHGFMVAIDKAFEAVDNVA